MGLFDQAIATCKQYLSPVKKAKRKLVQLEQLEKLKKENDDFNEKQEFDEIFSQFTYPNEEAKMDYRANSMAVIKAINQNSISSMLSPIAETNLP